MNSGNAPLTFAALLAQAEAHAASRDLPQAIAACEAALGLRAEDPDALVQLSYLHSLAGHYRLARDYALRANATGTVHPKILAELVPRLRTFNEVPALLAASERRPLSQTPIPLLITIAAHLSYVNLPERAIVFLDEARRADPDYPTTLLARAQVLIYLGRFDEAGQDIARALRRAPEIAQGWWLQASLRRQSPSSHHIDAIRAQLRRPGRPARDIALLGFALHKELDDLGDTDKAWEALLLGCHAKRSTLAYDARQSVELVDALMHDDAFPQPAVTGTHGLTTPVFIIGMHRSGTTLLEQMLDGSPQVRGIGELYDFTSAMREATDHHCRGVIDLELVRRAAHADFARTGDRYLRGLAWRLHGETFFTDKLPSNFLNAGYIARALPQAKLLHMVRDPVETCFSNLRELFSDANPYSYDLQELASYHQQYRRLMAHWHRRFPGRILDVHYDRLVSDPEAVMREVCNFCGINYDPAMLDTQGRKRGVVTASAVQVRAATRAVDTPKWWPYREQLQPLLATLH